MQVYEQVESVRKARWKEPAATWGLVPTMGYLHEGHLSLVRQACAENDRVGVSIFVNPKQFNNPEDLKRYPRNLEKDLAQLDAEGVDLVWIPTVTIVYPPGFQTYVSVEDVAQPLEGAYRPGHFQGVTTIVAKLFNTFQPTRAYFGQKDAQQVAVIKQMVCDLNFNLEIVVGSTVREADGLALSSRNTNLGPEARQQATRLFQALNAAKTAFDQGERDGNRLRAIMLEVLDAAPLAEVDYVSVAHPTTLNELDTVTEGALLSMAVFVDGVRLIDNISVES
jgi:pantoate--beta-alanine ligase